VIRAVKAFADARDCRPGIYNLLCGCGVAQLLQVAPSPGACAVPRAKAGVAPLTRATSARAANSVIVFIGFPSVSKYITAYDLAAIPHSDSCHELTTEPTSYGQWQVGVARPHHEILTERKVCVGLLGQTHSRRG
jgi:hypothetical protein